MSPTARTLVWLLAVAACAVVFIAWMNPHLALEVAAFLRSCF